MTAPKTLREALDDFEKTAVDGYAKDVFGTSPGDKIKAAAALEAARDRVIAYVYERIKIERAEAFEKGRAACDEEEPGR